MNKLSKIVLPKEVAQIIERYRSEGFSNATILQRYFDGGVDANDLTILDVDADVLLNALAIGYEIAKSPEDRLAEKVKTHAELSKFYEGKLLDICEMRQERYSTGFVHGVKEIAKSYGIKIEGVNA